MGQRPSDDDWSGSERVAREMIHRMKSERYLSKGVNQPLLGRWGSKIKLTDAELGIGVKSTNMAVHWLS